MIAALHMLYLRAVIVVCNLRIAKAKARWAVRVGIVHARWLVARLLIEIRYTLAKLGVTDGWR